MLCINIGEWHCEMLYFDQAIHNLVDVKIPQLGWQTENSVQRTIVKLVIKI